jgi:hypothetical protein
MSRVVNSLATSPFWALNINMIPAGQFSANTPERINPCYGRELPGATKLITLDFCSGVISLALILHQDLALANSLYSLWSEMDSATRSDIVAILPVESDP